MKIAKWEGRCVNGLLKEHDRDMWLSWTQTSTVSEHANKTRHYLLWDKVKFIYDWYSWKVKEAIHAKLHPNNINWDKVIEILEACVDAYDQTADGSEQFPPLIIPTMLSIKSHQTINKVCDTPITNNYGGADSPTQ